MLSQSVTPLNPKPLGPERSPDQGLGFRGSGFWGFGTQRPELPNHANLPCTPQGLRRLRGEHMAC